MPYAVRLHHAKHGIDGEASAAQLSVTLMTYSLRDWGQAQRDNPQCDVALQDRLVALETRQQQLANVISVSSESMALVCPSCSAAVSLPQTQGPCDLR